MGDGTIVACASKTPRRRVPRARVGVLEGTGRPEGEALGAGDDELGNGLNEAGRHGDALSVRGRVGYEAAPP